MKISPYHDKCLGRCRECPSRCTRVSLCGFRPLWPRSAIQYPHSISVNQRHSLSTRHRFYGPLPLCLVSSLPKSRGAVFSLHCPSEQGRDDIFMCTVLWVHGSDLCKKIVFRRLPMLYVKFWRARSFSREIVLCVFLYLLLNKQTKKQNGELSIHKVFYYHFSLCNACIESKGFMLALSFSPKPFFYSFANTGLYQLVISLPMRLMSIGFHSNVNVLNTLSV